MRLLSGPSLGAMLCDFGARGRNGIASVRRYLDDRGPGYVPAATGIESRTMQILRQVGIVVERQVDLGGEESWTGRVDFLVVGLPIIVEVQSELHHAALVDRVADDARRARLEADGFIVVELWDTWLIGADIAGRNVSSTLYVAVVDDLDGNGILDDAPDVVPDANGDGLINSRDLRALGLASNVEQVRFYISGDPA